MKTTVTIANREYTIKYTIRALFIFEAITKKAFALETLLDSFIFFYSMILANNESPLTWDEFLDALDNDPELYMQFQNLLNQQNKVEEVFPVEDADSKKA